MVIDGIVTLRDCGVFRDFHWPNELPGFGRYNLIYGWNGSGKTTISRLLRALENKTPPPTGQVIVTLDGRNTSGEEFTQVMLPVRVFNRDFVTEGVFPVAGGEVPPIFVVGKESVEKQKEVDRLKDERTRAEADLAAARSAKQNAERIFDRFCIDRARVIKDTLRSSGSNPYNNYDKSSFQERAKNMPADSDAVTPRLSDAEREKLLTQHRATLKPKLPPLTYQSLQLQPLRDAVSDLLSTTVVSAAIRSLKDDPEVSAWARHGLGLHQERHAAKCLFCEQTVPKDRLAALEAHFNAEYEQFLKRLDDKITEIQAASKTAFELALPNRAQLYDDLASEYATAEAALRESLNATRQFLDSLAQVLTEKRGRAFQPVDLDDAVPEVDSGVVDRLTEVIGKHNQACDEFQNHVNDARRRLEADFVAETHEEFVRLGDAVRTAGNGVGNVETKIKERNVEIAKLEREIVEHRRPAEELNDDLHNYLGHDELRLDIKDTGYTITRNDVRAHALSEGEMTAIALLYFLKSLQDRRFDLKNGVVVLDDPVSSLDANALYLAFGFIRERTKDAAQLFILTHNFTLFRQVRNWFHHLKGQNKKDVGQRPARFYMLDCAWDGDQRFSSIRPLDPLLEQYESEYHYLFARIYRGAAASTAPALEENYVLPNMARRLLEAFLAFRQPNVSGELWQKLKDVEFDEAKKLRILRFLHTHSHDDSIGEPEHDPFVLGEATSVLKDVLDFMEDQDPDHFAAMVKVVNPPDDEEDDE